ncbi:hypothetical protein AB0B89_10350 [Sphaerisporangium sp. NPDC049002]|uniref:hypothetical protein n=1 Tax=Sphaerisporangium sp. NPDC049002 TaxID=3155392 RepID=UPI0033E195C8
MSTHIVITDTNLGDGSIERGVLVPAFEVSHHDARTEEEAQGSRRARGRGTHLRSTSAT